MSEPVRSAPSPARFGLTEPRAEQDLRDLGLWGPDARGEPVLAALSRSADPDLALRNLNRLREAAPDWAELSTALAENAAFRGRLLSVFGTSSALGDFVVAHPDEWHRLLDPAPELDHFTEALLSAVGADPGQAYTGTARAGLTGNDAVKALRRAYRGQLLLIAAADLGHVVEPELPDADFGAVTGCLTGLAEATLRAALAVAAAGLADSDGNLPCELAVIAMGKTGGRELNYVSDVDVVFVCDGDMPTATKLASSMIRIATEAAIEVDAALRPEGKAGALVRTIDGHTTYYKRWARTWEFQALLKARPVAGNAELGQRYVDALAPMVWTAADRENFVADVQAMRRRVEDHVPAGLVDRELKLGRGGLRDVEFAVQLLQLVHGRGDAEIRAEGTVDALAALGERGYVGREDAAKLGESYRFLRRLEHRLQLRRLRRTHLFPAEDAVTELRWLARSAGIEPRGGRAPGDLLLEEFRRVVGRIRRLHEKLFYRPLLEAVARVPTEALTLTTAQAEARLAALGYVAADGALRHIRSLTSGVTRAAHIQQALLPVLLDLLATTPDPDGGLLAYRRVSEALAETPWYLRVLRDEGAVVERLATLLGTSKLVPDLIVRAPEVLHLLSDIDQLTGRDPAEVASSLRATVNRQSYLVNAVGAARSLRRHELLRVACADLLGLVELPDVCAALSSVWTAVLDAALFAVDRAERVAAGGRLASIAVIGMGRLGGQELGYGSDADVLFVCEPAKGVAQQDALRYATWVAQTVQRLLGSPSQDPALVVDADLRPEGRNGPLVRTLESYQAYYAQWGEVWEAQALLRARFVAGDPELGARFLAIADPVRYPAEGLDAVKIREIRRIKARVEKERLPRGADVNLHTKLGRGGLADVEWTLQLLQLQHAHHIPELRTTSTMDGLRVATDAGLLDAADAQWLTESWLLATKVRNAIMLARGKPLDQLPKSGRELTAVAKAAGRPDDEEPGQFLDDYRKTTRHARAVVERVFYGW